MSTNTHMKAVSMLMSTAIHIRMITRVVMLSTPMIIRTMTTIMSIIITIIRHLRMKLR